MQSFAQNSFSHSLSTSVALEHNYSTTETVVQFVQTNRPVVGTAHAVFSVRFRPLRCTSSLGGVGGKYFGHGGGSILDFASYLSCIITHHYLALYLLLDLDYMQIWPQNLFCNWAQKCLKMDPVVFNG